MGAWVGILGTLCGVIVGGYVTYFVNKRKFEQERDERRRVAAMQFAAQLQTWLVETMQTFRDHDVFYQPDPDAQAGDPYGYYFPRPNDIPPFPFADNLDRVAQLASADAESLFNLVQKKASAEREARIAAETVDYEKASEVFGPMIAQAWLEGLRIYQALTGPLSWSTEVVTASELADMRERATPKATEPAHVKLADGS